MTRPAVAVIGGGVSGVTTALLLQIQGFNVDLFTSTLPNFSPKEQRRLPGFATIHAAASVLPHSVASPELSEWTSISQRYFKALSFISRAGVREQIHFEVFEEPKADPVYATTLLNFRRLSKLDSERSSVPYRSGAEVLSGWQFDALFCEAPTYIPYLYELFTEAGGALHVDDAEADHRRIDHYLAKSFDAYVNCTGEAAHQFLGVEGSSLKDDSDLPHFEPLDDASSPRYILGHYILVDIPGIYTNKEGRFFSYNYSPTPDVYATPGGLAADVYCYPRSDRWLLGGSRLAHTGALVEGEPWPGENLDPNAYDQFLHPDGSTVEVPRAILQLNRELILRITEGKLDLEQLRRARPEAFVPGFGLRYQRSEPNRSIRIAASRVHFGGEKFILHNYGHGGSGYTLSWGCAAAVLRLLHGLPLNRPSTPPPANRTVEVLQGITSDIFGAV